MLTTICILGIWSTILGTIIIMFTLTCIFMIDEQKPNSPTPKLNPKMIKTPTTDRTS